MTYQRFILRVAIVLTVLTLMTSVALAETPDECAARLDLDIRVGTIADAINWYHQVMRECVQDEGAGEGILRLTLSESQTLPNTNCSVSYFEAATFDDVLVLPRLFEGSIKLHWRHGIAGEWQAMVQGEIGIIKGGDKHDQYRPFELPNGNVIIGAGAHQFELRTRNGADKFELLETWPAAYLVDIDC